MKKITLSIILSLLGCNLLFAQEEIDTLKSEEKFDLFYKLYFTEINKPESTIDVFGLAEGHQWRIIGGSSKYKNNLLKDIANDLKLENPVKLDSALIVIDSSEKIKRYLHEQYFNKIRLLFSVENLGGKYKFITYGESKKSR